VLRPLTAEVSNRHGSHSIQAMTRFCRTFLFVLSSLITTTLTAEQPKNIILLIGDGMGPAHVTLMSLLRGPDFSLRRMSVAGFFTTRAANKFVTDSAAGGTALATGVKTDNHMLGVDPSGAAHESVLERAHALGKATGFVTTAAFCDATPGAFTSHTPDRYNQAEVARQQLESNADILAGTGLTKFSKLGMPSLATMAKEHGYQFATSRAELDAAGPSRILVAFPEQEHDLDTPNAPLPMLAKWAIDRLSKDPDGFFLLIEHEGTDSSSHARDDQGLQKSLVSLDEAVMIALDYAKTHKDTLVVVTADHETGGLLLQANEEGGVKLIWGAKDHTASAIPIFAFGPGAELFGGFMDNTDVGKRLISLETKPSSRKKR
jgi:alkaline phosphatase